MPRTVRARMVGNSSITGIGEELPVNRPERVLLVRSIGKHIGEFLKIVAEGRNESRRKDREFMALPGQEYAR